MDTQVNIRIRSEDIHHGFVVDQLFNNKGREVKADHVGLLDQVPKRGDLVIHVKFVGMGEGFQTLDKLLFQAFLLVVSTRCSSTSRMAMGLAKRTGSSLTVLMASRRACSFEDSILDRMLDSRLLGLNTFAMAGHLLLMDSSLTFIAVFIKKILGPLQAKKGDVDLKIMA
jgi:hypothetical protein